jgi:hypothetical protein
MVSSHFANGRLQTTRAPLAHYEVVATETHGLKTSTDIDTHGEALLRIPAGVYSVTTSLADACQPHRITVRPSADVTIELACAAP